MSEGITHAVQTDGFGSQYNAIFNSVLLADLWGKTYYYTPMVSVEHNYNNESDFKDKLEKFINVKSNFPNVYPGLQVRTIVNCIDRANLINAVKSGNFDMLNSNGLKKLKSCFWENKEKPVHDYLNIGIHIRRRNPQDNRNEGTRLPDEYFLFMIKYLREKYNERKIIFNIYSQGELKNFEKYLSEDVRLNIDTPVMDTFLGLASSDILLTSLSTLSYTAGLISNGEVYFVPSEIEFGYQVFPIPKEWKDGWNLFKYQ